MKTVKRLFAGLLGFPPTSATGNLGERVETLIDELRAKGLTYVGKRKLRNLAWAAQQVEKEAVKGDVVEAGVALGGTAILLAKLKPQAADLLLFDVFGMIPPPGENDGADAHDRYSVIASGRSDGLGDKTYYGYIPDLMSVVRANLASFGVLPETHRFHMIQGLYQDSLHISAPVALAHIDCDWYDSVKVCIERIFPHVSAGGYLVFDDYKSYSGCRRAVDEWLAARPPARIVHADKSVVVQKLK